MAKIVFPNNNNEDINKMLENIMKSVDTLIDNKIKDYPRNYCVYGQVKQCNINNTYDVMINNQVQTVYSINDNKYKIGDSVIILVVNSNYQNKYILCKKHANII